MYSHCLKRTRRTSEELFPDEWLWVSDRLLCIHKGRGAPGRVPSKLATR